MLNALTNRLSRLEAALVGRECSCPAPTPEPLRPGFRVVGNREIHLGRLPCPACGGLREMTIVENALVQIEPLPKSG
jgi:hypothetical protein